MEVDWIETLEITKNAKVQLSDDSDAFLQSVDSYFQPCYEQFSAYAQEMSRNKTDSILDSVSMKKLVLQTRAALRFGLCCNTVKAMESSSEESVTPFQSRVVVGHQWHEPLAKILTYRRGDKKCRTFAAQLMSNLVTSNTETASIVASSIRIAPSAESISSSILESVPCEDHERTSTISLATPTTNWVDMIISAAKSGNRDAIAAIAAALHNCISSMPKDEDAEQTIDFVQRIASNGLLISTLLRNFVSAEAVTKAIENEKLGSNEQSNHWDTATDWIQLLLSRLAKLGTLPKMFTSIDATSNETSSGSSTIRILPEQNILLQCMAREADGYVVEYNTNRGVQNPFGTKDGTGNASCAFLAELLVKMSPWFRNQRIPNDEANQHDRTTLDEFHDQLIHSGFLTVIEILATVLGVDTPQITELRLLLGRDSAVLQESAKCLGVVLDDLAEKSEGRKARDIKLSEDDQKLLTSLVQFVGNLCYGCKDNQDLLRTTLVPRAKPLLPRVEEPTASEDSATTSNGIDIRNGLHVLLTCTTHATACFTLREWGVIAIRNVLEDNTENQSVVKDLMAQGPVESADLEEAGVRVQLDSKGKVSLATIDEKET